MSDYYKTWYNKNREKKCEQVRLRGAAGYYKSPRAKYNSQKQKAKQRGIVWGFTFETWWALWERDWDRRGCHRGDLVMARLGDAGPYAPDNVRLVLVSDNLEEARRLRVALRPTPEANTDSRVE